jgi:hypothetical protein
MITAPNPQQAHRFLLTCMPHPAVLSLCRVCGREEVVAIAWSAGVRVCTTTSCYGLISVLPDPGAAEEGAVVTGPAPSIASLETPVNWGELLNRCLGPLG